MDRSSYSSRTLSTFEIIASYFVDFYYNGLYNEAVKFKESGKVENITQGYRHTVYRFMQTINSKSAGYNPKFYARMLRGINEWFTIHTSFSTLTLSDCIDKITCEFIPEDFQDSIDKDQRRSILREIMNKVLNEFSRSVIHEYLVNIIDQHKDEDNIDLLKDKFIDLLLVEREAMYQRFMDTNAGRKVEMVDKALVIRMRQELEKQVREKVEFRERARIAEEKLKNMSGNDGNLVQLEHELKVKDSQIENYREQIDMLKKHIDELRRRNILATPTNNNAPLSTRNNSSNRNTPMNLNNMRNRSDNFENKEEPLSQRSTRNNLSLVPPTPSSRGILSTRNQSRAQNQQNADNNYKSLETPMSSRIQIPSGHNTPIMPKKASSIRNRDNDRSREIEESNTEENVYIEERANKNTEESTGYTPSHTMNSRKSKEGGKSKKRSDKNITEGDKDQEDTQEDAQEVKSTKNASSRRNETKNDRISRNLNTKQNDTEDREMETETSEEKEESEPKEDLLESNDDEKNKEDSIILEVSDEEEEEERNDKKHKEDNFTNPQIDMGAPLSLDDMY